jgi:hypothetical protein
MSNGFVTALQHLGYLHLQLDHQVHFSALITSVQNCTSIRTSADWFLVTIFLLTWYFCSSHFLLGYFCWARTSIRTSTSSDFQLQYLRFCMYLHMYFCRPASPFSELRSGEGIQVGISLCTSSRAQALYILNRCPLYTPIRILCFFLQTIYFQTVTTFSEFTCPSEGEDL